MGKYIHLYDTENEFDEVYNGDGYLEPWVSYTKNIDRVDYNAHREDWSTVPLTIEIVSIGETEYESDSYLSVGRVKDSNNTYSYPMYSINGGEWSNSYVAGCLITGLTVGDEIQFKATGVQMVPTSSYAFFYLNHASLTYNIKGNIASMFYGDDFEDADGTGLANNCCSGVFRGGFSGEYGSSPVDASKLVIPFEVIPNYGCANMFTTATELVLPPDKLPARTLNAAACYQMFAGCTSLIKTPDMTIENIVGTGACQYMFSGCTNLATAFKELPATALTTNCYSSMFTGCAALEKTPDILTESLVGAYSAMYAMFSGCTNLNYVKAMFVDLGSSPFSAYGYGWMDGVSQTGTFVKNVNAEWTESDVIPSGWTVETASS